MDIKSKFLSAIEGTKNIVISTHLFPDADGIGSQISLCAGLKQMKKNVICCNEEELLDRYHYLDTETCITSVEMLPEKFPDTPDLIIVVDTNTIERTGPKFTNYASKQNCPILYIDHHPCSQSHENDHCIDTTAAATGQLVGELLEEVGITLTQKIALPLYTAILIDTSSFRYPTVTGKTHTLISKLLNTGIKPPQAYNGIYGTKKIQHMHLLGAVLSTACSNVSEEIAWIVLKKEELNHFNIDIEDTHAFINNLLILDKVKVACMFRDDGKRVKVSFRSNGVHDVGTIAVALGGGGHSHSAATIIEKKDSPLQDIITDVISKIEKKLPIPDLK